MRNSKRVKIDQNRKFKNMMYRYNGNVFHWNMDSTWNTSNAQTIMLVFSVYCFWNEKKNDIAMHIAHGTPSL